MLELKKKKKGTLPVFKTKLGWFFRDLSINA